MKRIYSIWLGPTSPKSERMLALVGDILSTTPHKIEFAVLVLWDEDKARQIAIRLTEAGFDANLGMRTEYDRADLDKVELLRLRFESLRDTGEECIRQTKPGMAPADDDPSWAWHSDPIRGVLHFDYDYAKGHDLLIERLSYALIVSTHLKEFFESNHVSGVTYHPLANYKRGSQRKPKPETGYFLLRCTSILPPLDPRVLVQPWRMPEGQPNAGWNFPVVSEYYYTRETLGNYCDVNWVGEEELGKSILPALIVSQRFRQLLSSWKKIKMEYEPVFIVGANESVSPQPNGWSWSPTQPPNEFYPQEIIPLAEARKKYRA